MQLERSRMMVPSSSYPTPLAMNSALCPKKNGCPNMATFWRVSNISNVGTLIGHRIKAAGGIEKQEELGRSHRSGCVHRSVHLHKQTNSHSFTNSATQPPIVCHAVSHSRCRLSAWWRPRHHPHRPTPRSPPLGRKNELTRKQTRQPIHHHLRA